MEGEPMKTAKRNIYKAYIRGVQGTTIEYLVYVKRSRMDLLGDRLSSIFISLDSKYIKYLNGVRA